MEAAERNPALRRALAKCPSPSNYFRWINDLTPCLAVLWARESTRWQDPEGNLNWQRLYYRRELAARGFNVLRTFGAVTSGQRECPHELAEAFAFARRHNAVLVSEAANRLVRPDLYHSVYFPDAPFMVEDLERVAALAGDTVVATILHPDMPEFEVRGYQTKRGLLKPQPRGAKKARGIVARERVLALHAEGYEQCEIHRMTAVPRSNISRWIGSLIL